MGEWLGRPGARIHLSCRHSHTSSAFISLLHPFLLADLPFNVPREVGKIEGTGNTDARDTVHGVGGYHQHGLLRRRSISCDTGPVERVYGAIADVKLIEERLECLVQEAAGAGEAGKRGDSVFRAIILHSISRQDATNEEDDLRWEGER